MFRRFVPVAFLVLLIPAAAHAVQSSVWDFSDEQLPGEWQVKGWTDPRPTAQGFRISTSSDGSMGRLTDFPRRVDVMQITASAPREMRGLLLWHRPDRPPDEVFQLPLVLAAGASGINHVDLTVFGQWDGRPDLMGFAFPAGTDITLEKVEFFGFSAWEKLGNAWKSFWTFDTFNGSSINFLWGPILRSTPVSREALFDHPPPLGWSANRVFYAVFAAGGLLLWLWQRFARGGKRRALLLSLGLAGGLWLFYDLRMGAEFLRYAKWDYDTYASRPREAREFRRFENFYRAIDLSLPVLTASPVYGYLGPTQLPLASRVQYYAYPSIATGPDSLPRPVNWLIFRRGDARVDGQGRLLEGDKVIAEGGSILQRFDETSFLYGSVP